MASYVPQSKTGYIVEIGAGTGVVTKEILKLGVAPDKIIVIEDSEHLVTLLVKRFPNIKIIHGNAVDLAKLLGEYQNKVDTIVSSLPWRILPPTTTEKIIQQIDQVLKKDGIYIQYTYAFKKSIFDRMKRYKKVHSKKVWFNLPPARIDVFQMRY